MRVGKSSIAHKVVAWVLAAAMVFSACPMNVRANEGDNVIVASEEISLETLELTTEEIETATETKAEDSSEETLETFSEEMEEMNKAADIQALSADEVESPIVDGNNVTFNYYAPDASSVNLAGQMNGWNKTATPMTLNEETGVWSITVEITDASCEYKFVVDGEDWVTDPYNKRYSNGNSVVYIDEQNSDIVEYIYSIYYMDEEHTTTDSASLWIWTDGVNGVQYFFDEAVTLSDGNTWLKANVKLPYESIHIIPRAHDNWDWQDGTKDFTNTDKLEEINLYLVKGEAKVSTSLTEDDDKDDNDDNDSDKLVSPVVNGTEITFNYYGPEAQKVFLAGEMNGWNPTATLMNFNEETGVWSYTVDYEGASCQYKFVVDGNWITDPLNENYKDGNSFVVLRKEEAPKGKYTYTIYYMDPMHTTADSASLWIWTDGVNGTQYFFDEAVTLEDGNTWLKASVKVDFEKLNIIPRAYENWAWQDADKVFVNETQQETPVVYLVNGDRNAYTSIPNIVKKETRYVIVEYTRPEGDYTGWNLYSWNTGYGNEVTADFEEVNGKMVAYLPVVETKEMVSFCMRRSEEGNAWAEKDGGDYNVNIPLDQTVVKATFVQGEGITGNLPYNTGYQTDVVNGKISFYYRSDSLYKDYALDSLTGKVVLVLDNEEYEMAYDEENERFVYTTVLSQGNHSYGYLVDGELVLDRFNEKTTQIDGVTYSTYTYEMFDVEVEATVTPSVIDYNDNAVITIKTVLNNGKNVKFVEACADLSELGLGNNFEISTELMAGTIAVRREVEAGNKSIPVTVKDEYGNIYSTVANVEVVERRKGNDFDWDEAVIYFTVTDRFFDGDSSNNDPYGAGSYNPQMGSMYHGGDFAGLCEKLDYLKKLGVNTVWITPIVENSEKVSPANGDENQLTTGYHGYWAQSFTELNKHLGTEEEFKTLLDEMHKRGMKLMVDVVLNHAGYDTESEFNNTFLPGKNMLRDKSTTVSGDDKKDGLAGLPDFVTEDSEVRELLVDWQTSWISKYDIDYYRVDTVKHVEDTTWKAFKNSLTLANPDFKMIGEYAGAGYATNAGQLGTGQMDSILDFDFNDKALDFVTGNLENVEKFMEGRNAGINNTATVGSFLGSHDEDGFMWRLINERHVDADRAYALSKVAATFMLTAKGQPVIYYGEELGQTGANNWPLQENRYDMNWSIANEDNDMLAHYTKLLQIRNMNTDVFAKGTRSTATLENDVIVINRTYGNQTLYVGFNINENKENEVELTLKENKEYIDLYNETKYTTDSEGKVTVVIPAANNGGTVVLKEAVKEVSTPDTTPASDNEEADEKTDENKVIVTEPTFTTIDGKVVTGWKAVIEAATEQAQAELVPLGDTVQSAIVDLFIMESDEKIIPASVVKEMIKGQATYRIHFMKNNRLLNVVVYNSQSLAEVKGDLDLSSLCTTDRDFGQGFKSLILDPRKKAIYGSKLSMAITFGKENAGKVAYVFHRNLETNTVEMIQCQLLGADGELSIPGIDNTDIIVLY